MRCQSCGMPLRKDPHHGGTEANGSKSTIFCSLCYAGGRFLDSCGSPDEMKIFVRKRMREGGFNPILAWLLTLDMAHLERWRQE